MVRIAKHTSCFIEKQQSLPANWRIALALLRPSHRVRQARFAFDCLHLNFTILRILEADTKLPGIFFTFGFL
jgi:hypothetical protein